MLWQLKLLHQLNGNNQLKQLTHRPNVLVDQKSDQQLTRMLVITNL